MMAMLGPWVVVSRVISFSARVLAIFYGKRGGDCESVSMDGEVRERTVRVKLE